MVIEEALVMVKSYTYRPAGIADVSVSVKDSVTCPEAAAIAVVNVPLAVEDD